MNILVTGGTGYIGSHTVIELIKAGHKVDIIDNLVNSKTTVLDQIATITGQRPDFYELDLCDYPKLEQLFAEHQYDLVIHFAGLKAVGESVAEPLKYYDNNIAGTINLLKCMQKYGVNKIIFSSSATVYGEPDQPKLNENCPVGRDLLNPYGKTKYMIEEILQDVAAANPQLSVVILRYFNPIGNHDSGLIGEDPNGIPNNLMPVIMKVAKGEIPELKIYGDDYPTVDGSGVRDYIHVVDLAKGHLAVVAKTLVDNGVHIYNLGTGKGTSVLEMVSAFEKASGQKLPYQITERRPGDAAEVFADPTKAKQELNWQTELTVDDAMRDTLKFLSKH